MKAGQPYERRRFLPSWLDAVRGERLDRLGTGLARRLWVLVVDQIIDNPDGPWLAGPPEDLRRVLRATPEAFAAAWVEVRAFLVFKPAAKRWEWPTLERADLEARRRYEMQDARNRLGGNYNAFKWLLLMAPGDDADDDERVGWLKLLARKRRHVVTNQERLLEHGGRVASRPWLFGPNRTMDNVLLAMGKAGSRGEDRRRRQAPRSRVLRRPIRSRGPLARLSRQPRGARPARRALHHQRRPRWPGRRAQGRLPRRGPSAIC